MIHYAAIMAVLIVILHSLPGITRSLDADFTRLDPVVVLKQLGCSAYKQSNNRQFTNIPKVKFEESFEDGALNSQVLVSLGFT